jgi:16S rRNA (guanine(966)-N(2))-methyltransferase RsmD
VKGGLRILGGTLRGRTLEVAEGVRPSGARLREALFSIWGARVVGATFLDLYAGSGTVGLEALSRGAASALFVEPDRAARSRLERNLRLAAPGSTSVVARPSREALSALARQGARFDLLFVDPPYAHEVDQELFEALARIAAPEASLVVEHRHGSPPAGESGRWIEPSERRYGDSVLRFYALRPAEPGS